MVSDLQALIANMDEAQIEALSVVALKIVRVKADQFTGCTVVELNTNQGALGDAHISQRETIRIGAKKRRKVRSKL